MRVIRAPKRAPAGAAKTAVTADVRFGKTFADDSGFVQTGNMPDRSGTEQVQVATSPAANQIRIPVPTGYYPAGAGVRSAEVDLDPIHIRAGRVIAGVTGSLNVTPSGGLDTSDANATAADILNPQTAYVNALKLTGTMPNNGAATLTASGTAPVTIPAGYHNGAGAVQQVSIPATKVQAGTTIAGVAGTMPSAAGTVRGLAASTIQGMALHPTNASYGQVTVKSDFSGYVDGTTSFKQDVIGLTPGNIKAGVKVGNDTSTFISLTGTFTADATATASSIVAGQTAYVNGAKITGTQTAQPANLTLAPSGTGAVPIPAGVHDGTGKVAQVTVPAANVKTGTTIAGVAGTMADRGAVTITPGTTAQAIAAGYHNGSGSVVGDPELASGNIRAGVNIFGVQGSGTVVDTVSTSGDASWILSGGSFWGGGSLINGTMPRRSGYIGIVGWTNNGDSVVEANLPYGYYEGGYQVSIQDTSLTPSNIRSGVSIFGVTGNLSGKTSGSTACTVSPLNGGWYYNYIYVSGLGFTPTTVMAYGGSGTIYTSFMSRLPVPGVGRVTMWNIDTNDVYMTGIDGGGGHPYAEMGAGYFMIPMTMSASDSRNWGTMSWTAYE